MATRHLSHTDFFSKLTDLLNTRQTKGHGSIFLSQKRLTSQPTTSPASSNAVAAGTKQPSTVHDDFSDLNVTEPLPLIVRATDGKGKRGKTPKVKASTIVKPEDMESFFARYAEVCKVGMMLGLKKRDRKGRKAKKKKAGTGATGVGEKA